jgi:hypothetical protein
MNWPLPERASTFPHPAYNTERVYWEKCDSPPMCNPVRRLELRDIGILPAMATSNMSARGSNIGTTGDRLTVGIVVKWFDRRGAKRT